MRTNDFSEIIGQLEKVRSAGGRILVITHERPDGDAVGSCCGMAKLLNENGYSADVMMPDEVPDTYKNFVPATVTLKNAAELNSAYGCVVNTDASTIKRLGLGAVTFSEITIPFCTLDHHPDNEIFGDFSYVDSTAAAASAIVLSFAQAANWHISKDAATLLLLGITTDTGSFRFDNTNPASHVAAAELIALGADNRTIIEKAYFSKPLNMALFEAELMKDHLSLELDGRFAYFFISRELLEKYSIDIRNTENLIENLRAIDGVTVAALIKVTSSPGIFKISLRSKSPSVSVGAVARRLNGGGHEMAAGGTVYAKSSSEACAILLKHVRMEFDKE